MNEKFESGCSRAVKYNLTNRVVLELLTRSNRYRELQALLSCQPQPRKRKNYPQWMDCASRSPGSSKVRHQQKRHHKGNCVHGRDNGAHRTWPTFTGLVTWTIEDAGGDSELRRCKGVGTRTRSIGSWYHGGVDASMGIRRKFKAQRSLIHFSVCRIPRPAI